MANATLNQLNYKGTLYDIEDSEARNGLATKADANSVYTKNEVDTALNNKADKSTTYTKTEVDTALDDKVDTESGKGLSSNDFTNEYKDKVDNSLSTTTAAETYQQKGNYATTSDISDMATETWVGQQGFLTSADEVPKVTSADDGKVLKASYSGGAGTYSWQTGGGSGGTSDYTDLTNKPQINSVTLSGNKSLNDLGIAAAADIPSVPITEIQKNSTTISPVSGVVNITVPTTAADVSAIPTSAKGTASGVAELDSNGKVPSSQLPSYVDDVIEGYYYNSKFYEDSAHTTEITGTTGKIYVDLSTNKTYRWSGSGYTEISESLALGTTSSTAFRGDYGSTAYTHATDSSRSTTAKSSGLYKIASTVQGHIASLTSVQKSDITALGIPAQDTTYTFNTAYNASTNKAATMADIEKGLLPSYVKKTGNVATTDKVVEAIGKLETKTDTNASNIATVDANNGSRNVFKITNPIGSKNEVSYITNADGSITVTVASTVAANRELPLTEAITNVYDNMKISGSPVNTGDVISYLITGLKSDGTYQNEQFSYNAAVSTINRDTPKIKFSLYIKEGATAGTYTFYPMIQSAENQTAYPTYQPYALPNTKITPELIELVDSGAKNLLINKATTTTSSAGLTYTVNTDKSITVTGSSTNHNAFNVGGSRTYADALPLPKGKYMVSGGVPYTSQKPIYIQFGVMSDSAASISWHNINYTPYELTISNDTTRIVYEIYSPDGSYSGFDYTFYPMICTKAAWDVSQKYVPYRPSYEETVEQVAENENNILKITPVTLSKRHKPQSADYEIISDLTISIPAGKKYLIHATAMFNNVAPKGVIINKTNAIATNKNTVFSEIDGGETDYGGLTASAIMSNTGSSAFDICIFVKYKSANASGSDVIVSYQDITENS